MTSETQPPDAREVLDETTRTLMSEEATGLPQRGRLRIFHKSDEDRVLTSEEAREWLVDEEETLEVPAAGAGSYNELAALLGLGKLEAYETSSSAGDWQFRLLEKPGVFLQQENRHPYAGFRYCLFEDFSAWFAAEESA